MCRPVIGGAWRVSPVVRITGYSRFSRELGMGIAMPLGSRVNVREVLNMLDVIDSTRFQDLSDN